MVLKRPVEITPWLLPGLHIGDGWVMIGYSKRKGAGGRTRYEYRVCCPVRKKRGGMTIKEFKDDDLQSGCQGGGLREGLESLLSFLGAAAESYQYAERQGKDGMTGENAGLFPREVVEWAARNSDEIEMLALEVKETKDCINEDA